MLDKDRIAGSAKQVKGAAKEVVGKAVGDAKLVVCRVALRTDP